MLIELKDVTKRYGEGPLAVTALDDVTLLVDRGEFVVVLGPSGSGKTTLLNVVGALDTASDGVVIVGGAALTGVAEHIENSAPCKLVDSFAAAIFQATTLANATGAA